MNNIFTSISTYVLVIFTSLTTLVSPPPKQYASLKISPTTVKEKVIKKVPTKISVSVTPTVVQINNNKNVAGISAKVIVDPTTVPTLIPTVYINPTQITYRIFSLSELANLNGANSEALNAAQSAYNIFLQTPNLTQLNFEQQSNILRPLIENEIKKVLDERKRKIQDQIDWYNNQNSNQQNQGDGALQECIKNKIDSINSNPYINESSRQSQIANAPSFCASQ